MKKKQRRGFLVALLIGFDEKTIHSWKVYTHSLRGYKTIKLPRKWKYLDDKQKYNLLEDMVNIIRPIIREGLKSIILANPEKEEYSATFLDHVKKHHQWLLKGYNRVSIGVIDGVADSLESAKFLISQEESKLAIDDTINDELHEIVKRLDKLIHTGDPEKQLLYTLEEIGDIVYEGGKKDKTAAERLDIIIITAKFIEKQANKSHVHRLLQIANNKGVKTKTISIESPFTDRFDQLGGLLAFKKGSKYIS